MNWRYFGSMNPFPAGALTSRPSSVSVRKTVGWSYRPPIGKTHQDLDFRVPRAACCPCAPVALADQPPVAPKQVV